MTDACAIVVRRMRERQVALPAKARTSIPGIVLTVLLLVSCDRLVQRQEYFEIPSRVDSDAPTRALFSTVRKSLTEDGYRDLGGCGDGKPNCEIFRTPRGADLRVSVVEGQRPKIQADFSSFGNLVDTSGEAFAAVRKAVQ